MPQHSMQSFSKVVYRIARYVVYALLLALAFRQDTYIANNPLQEDGYYSLTVARNLALGNGPTIDGEMHTSGFQPLVTAISSLCFVASGGDRILGLRFYLVLSLIVCALAAWLFASVVTRLLPKDAAVQWQPAIELFYLTSLYQFTMHFNGLETGVLLLGYILLARQLLSMPENASRSWTLQLGVLLGLMILTRIDVLVPASMLMMWMLVKGKPSRRIDVLLAGGCTMLIILPWFAYIYTNFGTIMPSGGAAQTSLVFTTERLEQAFINIAETLMPFAFLRFHSISTFWGEVFRMSIFLAVLPILWRTARALRSGMDLSKGAFDALAVGVVSMCIYYLATSFATWHYTRYFAPVALTIVALGLIAFVRARIRPLVQHTLFAAYTLLFVAVVGAMLLGKGAGNEMIVHQLALVEELVPHGEVMASGQTGTLGFMRDNVLNIDGKVNHEALVRKDDIPEYLSQRHVPYFCDEPELIDRFLGKNWSGQGWRIIGQKGNFVLLCR
jgi:hypothetical protein